MTTPLFASTVLEPNVMTKIITIPTNVQFATATLNICNTNDGGPDKTIQAAIRVGWGTGTTFQLVNTIDWATLVPPNGGMLIRSCNLVPPGANIFVMSDQTGVVVNFTALCQEIIAPVVAP